MLPAAGTGTRSRTSAGYWWRGCTAVLCSQLPLSTAAAFCQVLALKLCWKNPLKVKAFVEAKLLFLEFNKELVCVN